MPPPSLQLLRAIRATEYIYTHLPAGHTPSPIRCLPLHHTHESRRLRSYSSTSPSGIPSSIHSRDRGPISQEDTQTDFGSLDVLGNTPPPTTAIDACLSDGFHLDNGVKITGGSGCLLVGGEAFSWKPWLAGNRAGAPGKGRMINRKGQWDVEKDAWGLLDLLWPKPGEDGKYVPVGVRSHS